jgi:hypothetical protein
MCGSSAVWLGKLIRGSNKFYDLNMLHMGNLEPNGKVNDGLTFI